MAHLDTRETVQSGRKFIKKAMKLPMLEPEHEQKLARLWKDKRDEKALHELTSAHVRLVVAIAAKFRNYGLPMGDLVQEGNIGLMQAAERFDPDREVRFSTYAGWWIRSQIQDYVLRNWSIVRTGTTSAQKSLFFNMRRLRARINDIGANMTPKAAPMWRVSWVCVWKMSKIWKAAWRPMTARSMQRFQIARAMAALPNGKIFWSVTATCPTLWSPIASTAAKNCAGLPKP